ncbi:hypothetical protein SESBI_22213 [Sesbania bispinosa]|nr:hypothetical protein SESBI_22213 [Sesbania bispinosa]
MPSTKLPYMFNIKCVGEQTSQPIHLGAASPANEFWKALQIEDARLRVAKQNLPREVNYAIKYQLVPTSPNFPNSCKKQRAT